MTLEHHLRLAGCLLLALAGMHAGFPWYFRWHDELGRLSLINRQMFGVHVGSIALTVALFGLLMALWPAELLAPTPLAGAVLAGMTVFWLVRLCVQFFVYDRRLWRGRNFETAVHLLFSSLWLYLVGVLLAAIWLHHGAES